MATVTHEKKRRGRPKRKPRPVDMTVAREHLLKDIERYRKATLRWWSATIRERTPAEIAETRALINRMIDEEREHIRREITRLTEEWKAAELKGHHKRATKLGKRAYEMWEKSSLNPEESIFEKEGVRPLHDEFRCPDCGALMIEQTQYRTKQKTTKTTDTQLPRMDTPTKWVDIDTYRNRASPLSPFVPYCLGGFRRPQNQLGIDYSSYGRQRGILLYIMEQYHKTDFFCYFGFFEIMVDRLRGHNIIVSGFVLRHLCHMHVDRDVTLPEDREIESVARECSTVARGAVVCVECGACIEREYAGQKHYDIVNQAKDAMAMMVKESKVLDKKTGKRPMCEVCGENFENPEGASGICPDCAPNVYL